jgi:DNA-binding YbaB/EbfC family protein
MPRLLKCAVSAASPKATKRAKRADPRAPDISQIHPHQPSEQEFNHMKDLMGMMKKVGEMQAKLKQVQEDLEKIEVEGQSGGGLVKVTLDGKGAMRKVTIDPSLAKADEVEILEDLIVAAASDAKTKVDATMQSKMAEVTGGLPIPPGMKLF